MGETTFKLLGNSPAYLRMLHTIRMISGTDATVMITGEPGVGKLSVAEAIHANSSRNCQPLVCINCAGLSDSDFESLLPRGGASGVWNDGERSWAGGTLLLEEVGELSTAAQARLLRFLESEKETEYGAAGVRLLVSSSQDLHALVSSGVFREDLFYRLYIVPLEVPALRDRDGDLTLLLNRYTQSLARSHRRQSPRYSAAARNLLGRYRWPGNLRELHNLCERMVVLMAGMIIQPENLPLEIRRGDVSSTARYPFLLPADGLDLSALEGDMIRQALVMAGGNRSKAARLLRLSRDTLLYRIQKHAIEV